MSKIRRLSLRGIRNFGEDDNDGSIRFSCPMTLILGPNGTGKTTIIEALKYATSGEFPPGSDRGKSFIHDPALAVAGSIRGVVKAQIVDSIGDTFTVCRTIESFKMPKKFKTLDSTLTRVSKDKKEKASITNRCTDIDAELSIALGVSKSILNYVILCHQDELNWPFDQGKVLKDRFDEIFDSAKFNKASESIGKLFKELQTDLRALTNEKKSFNVIMAEVKSKEEKLKENKERLKKTKNKIDDIDKQLEPLNEKINEIQQYQFEYKNIQAEEEKKKMEYNMHKERYEKLKETMKNIFDGTTTELNERIKSHETILEEKNNEIAEKEDEIKNISEKANKISNILATRRETVGTLKQQVRDHEKRIDRRNQLLNSALSAWDFDTLEPDVSEIEVKALTKRLEQKMQSLERKAEESRLDMQEEEKELQKEVDIFRGNNLKIESEKVLKEKEVMEIRDEIATIRNQITQIDSAGNKLKPIERKLQIAKHNVEELSKTSDMDFTKADIENKIKQKKKMEADLNAIDNDISALHKLSSLTAEFELNKSVLLAKREELTTLREKHGDNIKALLDIQELPQTKLQNTLERIHQKLDKETSSLTQQIQAQERRGATFEATVRHMTSDITKKKTELENDKQKISAVCDYKNFDETLLMQSKIVKDLQDKRGMYAYQATAYKEYIKDLSVEKPSCPLCHRIFTQKIRVTDLIKEMENDVEHNQPHRLKNCETELKVQQEKYDNMLQLKPIVEKVIECEENELKKLYEQLEKTKESVKQSKTCIKDLEISITIPQKKLLSYKNIISDIKFWDRCIDEIQDLKKIVNNLEDQMANSGLRTRKTMEEVQAQRESLRTSIKETNNDIETLQSKVNKHNEQLQDARAAYNELHEEQLKIQTDMQKLKHLKDKQEDLYTKEIALGELIEKLREKLTLAEDELNSATQRSEKIKAKNWQKQENDRKLISEGAKRLSDLHNIISEVDAFINNNIIEKLANYEHEIETYQHSLTEVMGRKKDMEQKISKLKEDISFQEIEKRELLDNITLRKIKETIQTIKKQYNELNEKLRSMNYTEMVKRYDQLEGEKQNLICQKNMTLGKQGELVRVIQLFTQELQKEEYRLARQNYRKKCIELTVQENTVANLKAYSQILDRAMIEYHEERMSSVNKIMKKMWRHVYKGTDTSCIQIRTEPTEGIGGTRRTYNYKLVQTKHGCEMDMKGRCSAGQKVLASIIIRLALAQTFCKDCGILALDEPTTNLDEENASSLADTLTKVVALRSKYQKNFQLIIISHDEKFLQKLAALNNYKQFHELYRKESGMSAIRLSNFDNSTNAFMEVRDYDSDEEERRTDTDQDADVSSSSSRKRFNWNDFNEEDRPAKRYCSTK